jgi:integrase
MIITVTVRMNRTPLVALIVGIAVLTAALDFRTSAWLAGSVLFTFALVLCITQRSKWLLWTIATIAILLNVAAGFWPFHRIALRYLWVPLAHRGLVTVCLLTLATFVHLRIRKSRKAVLAIAAIELHNTELIARNEQLERELAKFKAVNKGKQKPLVLTIKQYQTFVGNLSEMHRAMVVTAMCSGLPVSEALALRWDQLDLATGEMCAPHHIGNGGTINTARPDEQISMDPVLVETLLEWRNTTHGTGLIFPSHTTGRCYRSGPIQQSYFRPVAEKLGLVGLCWQTFPQSYRSWLDEHGTPMAVRQKLMRHAPAATIMHNRGNASSKPKAKSNGKVIRQVPATSEFREENSDRASDETSDDASFLFKP